MYYCENCGMPLDDWEKQCWICSHTTNFENEIIYFYYEDDKPNPQTSLEFPE